jgi:hypothetical protein
MGTPSLLDTPGLMAGLSILRVAPVIQQFSRSKSARLARIAAICLRGNMPERWAYFQMAKLSAVAGREVEEGTPRFCWDSAGEVAALACLPKFSFTGSRLDDVLNLSLEFWATCDGLLAMSGLEMELAALNYDSSIESAESALLDADRTGLENARDPALEYAAMRLAVVNGYPKRRRLARSIAQAGKWDSR